MENEDEIPERYEKNPLYVIIENYILDSIGRLEPEKGAMLGQTISAIWGGKPEDWRQTTRATLDLPATTDEDLQELWKQKSEESEAAQETMSPEDFARKVVDENYANLNVE